MAPLDPRFAWTPLDNAIAEAELTLSKFLSQQLNDKPELSLNAVLKSDKVHAKVGPILLDLDEKIGKHVKATNTVWRNAGGSRTVYVHIEPE